jgi:hypothetical protein
MRTIRDLYSVFRQGDILTDDECVRLRDHTRQAAEHLEQLGPTFYIAEIELRRVNSRLEDICDARGLEK